MCACVRVLFFVFVLIRGKHAWFIVAAYKWARKQMPTIPHTEELQELEMK